VESIAYPPDDPAAPSAEAQPPRPAEERLAAALEALAARDGLIAERNRRLLALEDAADRLVAATARVDHLSAELVGLRLARRAELAERDARIAQLESALVAARQAANVKAAPDDLKQIKGIGPGIEALLHGIGITTFRQIAGLSADDRRRVGDLLGLFETRIERDDWVTQARALAQGPGGSPDG
jgi:predicted flap endonuclease-1-like 5' DNA nuclease